VADVHFFMGRRPDVVPTALRYCTLIFTSPIHRAGIDHF
jgi:hypothetical protein